MSRNALLKLNEKRARRMTDDEAFAKLEELGFGGRTTIRHSVARDKRKETLLYEYHRSGTRPDGSPFYDRARLAVTYSI